jgi:hypothetical protein
MSVLVISKAPGVTAEQDTAIVKALNLEGDPPPGARARFAGPTDDGWQIISLWDSRESFDTFVRDRLTPALQATGRPAPDFEFWPIENVIII